MMALTDEEKIKIKEEESYRHIIREEISQQSKPRSVSEKIWSLLNSPVGVVFLSTIVLGLASWGFGLFERARQTSAERSESLRRLDLEIAHRVAPMGYLFNSDEINKRALSDLESVFGNVPPKDSGLIYGPRNLFPTYESLNLVSALNELVVIAPESRRDIVKKAIQKSYEFDRLLKSDPKEKISLASNVSAEVHIFSPEQIKVTREEIIPAFAYWLNILDESKSKNP